MLLGDNRKNNLSSAERALERRYVAYAVAQARKTVVSFAFFSTDWLYTSIIEANQTQRDDNKEYKSKGEKVDFVVHLLMVVVNSC
eukprot:m.156018 g.156018  ORF g.156018 m.156018 type:complete len:85 (+) comp16287_c3_seq4:337-591(+)